MGFRTYKNFSIGRIEQSLRGVQKEFDSINRRLSLHREDLTDEIVDHILEAYRFLNGLMGKGVDLFSLAGLHSLLELNHIVLCGTDMRTRMEYHESVLMARRKYTARIGRIRDWVIRNRERGDPYRTASIFYASALSQPQLFVEGNHRTGNIVLNYLLVSRNEPPYVMEPETAVGYLEISGRIKFSDRTILPGKVALNSVHGRHFARFLRESADAKFMEEEE
ncbi:hypothetical protein L21SP4_01163 [Kiritimatiella glycovorans]|uniref:Fido domain-containing protein n=2 Tax=Kiritimatiella glycovorans TaxID=1307763 RepID=A0A0G3EG81_9BACT|nr:hypothetical protein L21SP4_01163 [Kiritimatiella glycovorans]